MAPEEFVEGNVIDGKTLAKKIRQHIKKEVEHLTEIHGTPPKLVAIIVGEDPGSKMYVRMKQRACKKAGILSETYDLPEDTSEEELIDQIQKLNHDGDVHGILVQLPLPDHIDEEEVIDAISPGKDVDGFSPRNIYRLFHGDDFLSAATPQGIVTMLDLLPVELKGKDAVIINRSTIVGKPLIFMLLDRDVTVHVCHSKTEDLSSKTKKADILVTAVGLRESDDDPYFITEDMVKDDAIVIDVATPKGDVDFEVVKEKASYITPVPGGVGPMTIAMLLRNVLAAYSYLQNQTNIFIVDAIDYGGYTS
ncbi:bifunctional 5,10-methylenetetrahydrofolate dehydrogenase/5,10-methenyltetrahydrofolate cyclohydrolase [Candidatus Thorarchaeota archaeon]|nr:MAG: bifunctional 5,10-methylenetetrahydrofolate dehydrogenase/5,10-methenyltetrahydrofolate cyclohydrolase [Candidatus Thorarchaeota archaeon]